MKRRDEKATAWEMQIGRWRQSGLSQREFCRRAGLSLSTLQWWLYHPVAKQRRQRCQTEGRSPFALVQLTEEPSAAGATTSLSAGVMVTLNNGRQVMGVTVTPGFDAATLRAVLAVLEGR